MSLDVALCECVCVRVCMCVCVSVSMCAYFGDDGILRKIKGNTAANVVQIDVELYLSLALSFSLSQ